MKDQIYLLYILVYYTLIFSHVSGRQRLTSLSSGAFAHQLYQRIGNDHDPSTNEFAAWDARTRKRICEEIVIGSGLMLKWFSLDLVDLQEIYMNRMLSSYSPIFRRLYIRRYRHNYFEYLNSYQILVFHLLIPHSSTIQIFREYAFACPVRRLQNNLIFALNVSKEYNVAPIGQPYKPGRFVIGPGLYNSAGEFVSHFLALAEERAKPKTERNFNVELHYLQMRKYIQPARSDLIDPLCRYTSSAVRDPNNEYHRLCTAVCTSSYFVYDIRYVQLGISYMCKTLRISFRTEAGMHESNRRPPYFERITRCNCLPVNSHHLPRMVYVSRSYISNQVFIYQQEPINGEMYLESLSTNISIVDKLNSFDFVEG